MIPMWHLKKVGMETLCRFNIIISFDDTIFLSWMGCIWLLTGQENKTNVSLIGLGSDLNLLM